MNETISLETVDLRDGQVTITLAGSTCTLIRTGNTRGTSNQTLTLSVSELKQLWQWLMSPDLAEFLANS